MAGWAFLALALAVILLVLSATARPLPDRAPMRAAQGVAAMPLPPVLPMVLTPVAPDDARAANAAVPLVTGGVIAARPFRFGGGEADFARARDCLAAAVLYEAGDDPGGQRAVAQVVLNRLRHPAFPKTVCGVVFQGSERATGCQFTFTCDGALARRYPDAMWARAQSMADGALAGTVDDRVGLATHYHTDWVRPYWSDTLDKIAVVDTHLFFRWPGFWGTPAAFRRTVNPVEPVVPKLGALSLAHRDETTAPDATLTLPVDATPSTPVGTPQVLAQAVNAGRDTILVQLDPAAPAEGHYALALQLCGDRRYCKLFGWTDATLKPATEALSDAARAGMSFSYLRDSDAGFERALWDCTRFPRAEKTQCMRR